MTALNREKNFVGTFCCHSSVCELAIEVGDNTEFWDVLIVLSLTMLLTFAVLVRLIGLTHSDLLKEGCWTIFLRLDIKSQGSVGG